MVHPDNSDDGVWERVYLALLSWALVGIGGLAGAGLLPGWSRAGWWSLLPVAVAVLGLIAAAVGPVPALVGLGGISGLIVAAGLYWIVTTWTVSSFDSPETIAAVGTIGTGLGGAWLTRKWLLRGSPGYPLAPERWWRTRWWLLLVVLGFPFAFGFSAVLLSVATTPDTGCAPSEERMLGLRANAFAHDVSGLRLGEKGGCDSGGPPSIEWDHPSLSDLLAAAKTTGCRDAYLEEWDYRSQFMVCGQGPTSLLLSIYPDHENSGASGDLSFAR